MDESKKRYAVDLVRDDPDRLQDKLNQIAEQGGRVVNVLWLPARTVSITNTDESVDVTKYQSGFSVISEHDLQPTPKVEHQQRLPYPE